MRELRRIAALVVLLHTGVSAQANEILQVADTSLGIVEPISPCNGMSWGCPSACPFETTMLVEVIVDCSMSGTVCCQYVNRIYRCVGFDGRPCGNWAVSEGGPSPGSCRKINPPVIIPGGKIVGQCQ